MHSEFKWISKQFVEFSVGGPIHVEKDPDPSTDKINEYHQKCIAELTKLFDEYKVKYGIPEETKLVFVWKCGQNLHIKPEIYICKFFIDCEEMTKGNSCFCTAQQK